MWIRAHALFKLRCVVIWVFFCFWGKWSLSWRILKILMTDGSMRSLTLCGGLYLTVSDTVESLIMVNLEFFGNRKFFHLVVCTNYLIKSYWIACLLLMTPSVHWRVVQTNYLLVVQIEAWKGLSCHLRTRITSCLGSKFLCQISWCLRSLRKVGFGWIVVPYLLKDDYLSQKNVFWE